MFGFDGSVRIKADLNHSPFDRGLSSMNNKVQSFSKTLTKLAGVVGLAFGTAALVNFSKEAVKAASSLNDAWMGLESIVLGQGKSFKQAKSFINDYISDGLVPLENAVTAYKNLSARGYSTEQIEKTLTALKDAAAFGRQSSYSLGEAVASAAEGLKNENSILVDNAGVTKNVAKMWDEYAKSIGTTANNLTQEQKIQAEVNGILEETRFQTGDAAKLVNTYSGQIAMLSYNFQQLKVAVGNALIPIVQAVLPGINAIIAALTKLANVFAKVTALLFGKSAAVKTKNGVESSAIGAANATDKLAEATEGAGEASKQAAEDMKGVQAGFDELNILAGKAASNLDDASGGMDFGGTADFDIPEFEADIGDFEEFEREFESLGELFVDTLDRMLAAIPDFRNALLEFAKNLNEFNKKLYDAFKFPGVVERAEDLGRELAKAFNDLVNAIDWELWGRTLGAGLNLGLQFLTEFLYTFDWINLGKKLAAFINGLVDEVDWYDFGRLLWAKFKIALETLAGFIIGLDMPALAKAASDIIMGFFNSMRETIQNIDWRSLGEQIGKFLANLDWKGIFRSVGSAIAEGLSAAFEFVSGFLEGLLGNWASPLVAILDEIADGFRDIAAVINKELSLMDFIGQLSPLQSILLGIAAGFVAIKVATAGLALAETIKKIVEYITKLDLLDAPGIIGKLAQVFTIAGSNAYTFSDAVKMVFGPGSIIAGIGLIVGGAVTAITNFIGMLQNGFSWAHEALMLLGVALTAVGAIILGAPPLIAAAVAGIIAALLTVVVFIKDNFGEEIKKAISGIVESLKVAFSAIVEVGKNIVTGLLSGIATAMGNILTLLYNIFVKPIVDGVKNLFGIHSPSTVFAEIGQNLIAGLLKGISDTWNSIVEFFSNAWENIKTNAITAWENIKTALSAAWDSLKESASTAFNNIRDTVSGAWENIKQKSKETWENIKSSLSQTWDNIKTGAQEKFNAIKQKITESWENIKQTTISVWDSIKSDLSAKWEAIKTAAVNAFSAIKEKIVTAWNNIKSETSAKWNEIKSTLMQTWENLKSTAENSFNAIKEKIISAWETLKTSTAAKWTEIKTTLINAWTELKNSASSKFQEIKQSIIDKFNELRNFDWAGIGRSIVDGILNGLKGIFNSLTRWASDVWDTITGAFSVGNAKSSVRSGARSYYSGSTYRMDSADVGTYTANYSLPKLANGAVIPPNQQFAAILGDQRSGKNLETPAALIRQMVTEGIQAAGVSGRNSGNMTVIMEIDGREFGRASYKYGNQEQQRVGVRLVEVAK